MRFGRLIDSVNVKSSTHPGVQHAVLRFDDWTYTCTCTEFIHNRGCRHGFELLVRHGVAVIEPNGPATSQKR